MKLKVFRRITTLLLLLLTLLSSSLMSHAQSTYDAMTPFGFATCTSRTATGYSMTGGGAKTPQEAANLSASKVTTLQSTGSAMDTEILNAIKNYDVIIFDGSKGDFIVKAYVTLNGLSNKTLLGINNAKIATQWYATAEDVQALEDAGVSSMSTSGSGGTLSNGIVVKEQAEYNTRQIMINRYNDQSEWWCKSGIFYVKGCTNIIFRNLSFQGPGAMDLGGSDLVSIIDSSTHIWVDHCDFADGQDGNMDITNYSDFVTVSWCHFHYTSRSYMHQNTNLCGSSDSKTGDDDKLSITWAYNQWGTGCAARMPMARFGRFHMLNNYYSCTGNKTACMNPRINSEFLIEGNYFDASLTKVYTASEATKVIWRSNNSVNNSKASSPTADDATAANTLIPYTYSTSLAAANVPTQVGTYKGATLFGVTAPTISAQPQSANYSQNESATALSVTASASNGGTLSYQWYSNTSNTTTSATAISGATKSTYTPSTSTAGTTYYYCLVMETGYTSATSSIASITVAANNECDITSANIAGNAVTISGTTINASIPYSYSTNVPVALTISGGATASIGTSFNMTLAAAEASTQTQTVVITAKDGTTQKTYTIHLTRGGQAIVLDAVGNKVTAGGTFSNSTCTSSIAIGGTTEVSDGSDKSASTTNTGTVYRSSDATDFSISLVSTSASKIVIGATSSGSSERKITGVYVDGTDVTSSCTITGSFANKSTVHRITITGLNVAQGSTVRFTTNGNSHIYYYEITASSNAGAAKTPSDLTITSDDEVELIMGSSTTSQINTSSSNTSTAITYSSDATGVATVSNTGLITAVSAGTAHITVTQAANDTYALGTKTVTVTVSKQSMELTAVAGGSVEEDNTGAVTLNIDGTAQITATGDGLTYESNAEGVAKVSNTGLITAVSSGTAIITITQAATSTFNAGTATVTVTVSGTGATYTVSYNLNNHGDGTIPTAATGITAYPTTLPTPKQGNDNYYFVKWTTDQAGNNEATSGGTITGNTTLYAQWVNLTLGQTEACPLTLGDETYKASVSTKLGNTYNYFVSGTVTNGSVSNNEPVGTCYKFVPTANGTLKVAIVLNANKTLCVIKGTTSIINDVTVTDKENETKTLGTNSGADNSVANKLYGYATFDVEANQSYFIYCSGSKLGLYGYTFTASTPETPSTNSAAITWDLTGGTDTHITSNNGTFNASETNTFNDTKQNGNILTYVAGSGCKLEDSCLKGGGKTSVSNNNFTDRYYTLPSLSGNGVLTVEYASTNTNNLTVRNVASTKNNTALATITSTQNSVQLTGLSNTVLYISMESEKAYIKSISWSPVMSLDASKNFGNNSATSFTEGTCDVTFTRTFIEGNWTTLALPFNVTEEQITETFENNEYCEFASITSMDLNNGVIRYRTQSNIEANIPVLAKIKPNTNGTYTFKNVTVVNPTEAQMTHSVTSGVQLVPVYSKTNYTEYNSIQNNLWFIYNSKFYDWTYLGDMNPFQAYIYNSVDRTTVQQAKSFTFIVDDEETSINEVYHDVLEKNVNNEFFNVTGQRVNCNAKGLLIINGKKVFIK